MGRVDRRPGPGSPEHGPEGPLLDDADDRGRRLRRMPHESPGRGQGPYAHPDDRSLPALRAELRHPCRSEREVPRPGERQRRTAQPGLRPPGRGAPGPDREEALLPFPAGQQRAVVRHVGMPAPLPVLPELGVVAVDAGRPRCAVHVGPGHGGPGGGAPRTGHRLHLQRADGVRRVPARRGGGSRDARHSLGDGELRLREGQRRSATSAGRCRP